MVKALAIDITDRMTGRSLSTISNHDTKRHNDRWPEKNTRGLFTARTGTDVEVDANRPTICRPAVTSCTAHTTHARFSSDRQRRGSCKMDAVTAVGLPDEL
jgi:hypothetical protein